MVNPLTIISLQRIVMFIKQIFLALAEEVWWGGRGATTRLEQLNRSFYLYRLNKHFHFHLQPRLMYGECRLVCI